MSLEGVNPVVTADATHPTAAHQVGALVTTAPSSDTPKQVQNAAPALSAALSSSKGKVEGTPPPSPPPLRSSAPPPTDEIEHTVTGYWTFYNTTAKPAGVAYTHALNIANKHGDDWKTAIAKLRQAVAEA